METEAWTIIYTCTVFRSVTIFPTSYLLSQNKSLPTTLSTTHQKPNYQKQTRASVVKSSFNSTQAQQQPPFCSDSNIKQLPNKHNIFQKHQQWQQTKRWKSSASCPRHSKSANARSGILSDKETSSPIITTKSIFLLKQIKGWHTKQITHSIF